MADGIYAALTGAVAQAQALEVVSNNLANANTTGFKRDHVTFRESLARAQGRIPVDPTARHVAVDEIRPDFQPGTSRDTGNPLDVSVDGPGFFAIQTATGEQYTRAGAFRLLPDGVIATQEGDPVLGASGPIRVDPRRVFRLDERGTVWSDDKQVGHVRVVEFSRREGLSRQGGSLWAATPEAGTIEVTPRLRVGAIEQSNVNAVEAMTQLVWISRAYESFHRTIEVFRATDERTVTDLGR
jgi:flagellar basal-body rod protein FlgF